MSHDPVVQTRAAPFLRLRRRRRQRHRRLTLTTRLPLRRCALTVTALARACLRALVNPSQATKQAAASSPVENRSSVLTTSTGTGAPTAQLHPQPCDLDCQAARLDQRYQGVCPVARWSTSATGTPARCTGVRAR